MIFKSIWNKGLCFWSSYSRIGIRPSRHCVPPRTRPKSFLRKYFKLDTAIVIVPYSALHSRYYSILLVFISLNDLLHIDKYLLFSLCHVCQYIHGFLLQIWIRYNNWVNTLLIKDLFLTMIWKYSTFNICICITKAQIKCEL